MTSDEDPPECSTVVDLLADYLDGKLSERIHGRLERHLNGCEACIAYLRTYRSTVSLLRSLSDEDLPIELRTAALSFLKKT